MKPWGYYNDHDPQICAWVRELMRDGLITEGEVDERSVADVQPDDLRGFTRHHFFCGIAGWDLALQLAGWPADRPVWTASLPCQPFSAAGKRQGQADERHLWPHFHRLIRESSPGLIFGEQVPGAIGLGWLDRVFADLEADSYACGAIVLGAHSVGAPHIRQRLYWVADAQHAIGRGERQEDQDAHGGDGSGRSGDTGWLADTDETECTGRPAEGRDAGFLLHLADGGSDFWSDATWHPCADGKLRQIPAEPFLQFTFDGISSTMGHGWDTFLLEVKERTVSHASKANARPGEVLRAMWMAAASEAISGNARGHDAVLEATVLLVALCELARREKRLFDFSASDIGAIQEATLRAVWSQGTGGHAPRSSHQPGLERPSPGESDYAVCGVSPREDTQQEAAEGLHCLWGATHGQGILLEALSAVEEIRRSLADEGETRGRSTRFTAGARVIVAARAFPLAPRVPGRVGLLRGAGNSVVPQAAAEFIKAYLDVRRGR